MGTDYHCPWVLNTTKSFPEKTLTRLLPYRKGYFEKNSVHKIRYLIVPISHISAGGLSPPARERAKSPWEKLSC